MTTGVSDITLVLVRASRDFKCSESHRFGRESFSSLVSSSACDRLGKVLGAKWRWLVLFGSSRSDDAMLRERRSGLTTMIWT